MGKPEVGKLQFTHISFAALDFLRFEDRHLVFFEE